MAAWSGEDIFKEIVCLNAFRIHLLVAFSSNAFSKPRCKTQLSASVSCQNKPHEPPAKSPGRPMVAALHGPWFTNMNRAMFIM